MKRATEHELIRRATAGDGDAFAALIAAHQESLYAFMLRMSGRPHVAEDIVQEAFVRVLTNLDRFDSRFRFSTWLFTIAKRLYVNAMQKQRPLFDTDAVNGLGREGQVGSAEAEALDNARGLIDLALEALSAQQREIVLLFHQQAWPITRIAEHLSMPEGTVKSHLHRARLRMRRAIVSDRRLCALVEEVWT
jgi:RNA polymerase sigma-70 factor (ECF subfamily)